MSDLIGKPYAENGRGPAAYDCWGICLEVYHRLNRHLPEHQTPADIIECNQLFVMVKETNFRRIEHPEPWCFVVFWILDSKGKEKWHAGIVLPDCRRFIHVIEKRFVSITRLNEQFWYLFREGYYRYAG